MSVKMDKEVQSPAGDRLPGSSSRFRLPRPNLRIKFVLAVTVPIVLMITILSIWHNQRERHALEDQLHMNAERMGEVILNSLHHAMLVNDQAMVNAILANQPEDTPVHIIDLKGEVKASSHLHEVGTVRAVTEPGCLECHQFPPDSRPATVKLAASPNLRRVSIPIANEPECTGCHTDDGPVLGMLITDVSLIDLNRHLAEDFRTAVLISVSATVIFTLGLLWLIHKLVIARMSALRAPLMEFAAGNFSVRLPVSDSAPDELDTLGHTFNQMATDLEHQALEREERTRVQGRAIIEERERIARELHDGLAQLLGYVNTKLIAVRLMLKNNEVDKADQNLLQLEESTRELFVNVREAILGLRMASRTSPGLVTALQDFLTQYDRFCELPVEFHYSQTVEDLSLGAETELQLLRIAQEALTNVRKHASATRAWVNLDRDNGLLTLSVVDNGVGFDPNTMQDWSHYGLDAMRERAEAVGATLDLSSSPDAGTQVIVHLSLKGDGAHAGLGRR